MNEEQLKYQIENYNTKGFLNTSRKVATAVMIFLAILSSIFLMPGLSPHGILDAILILILAFFVYRGSKQAMMITMIYWTLARGLQFFDIFSSAEGFDAINALVFIIFWAIIMATFWKAYQVEKEREKIKKLA